MNKQWASAGQARVFSIVAVAVLSTASANARELLEDIVEKTLPLSSSGTFALRSIDGTVQIYGSNSNEVKIVAIKKAFSPARLNGIQVHVDAEEDAVNISTIAPSKPDWALSDRSGTIDYIINIPQTVRIVSIDLPTGELVIEGMRGAPIAASVGNGRLATHNCFCDQKMQADTGVIDVAFDWLEEQPHSIEVMIDDGNAHASIPSDASFELNAIAENGRVASDFSEIENRKRGGVSKIHERIGEAPFSKLSIRATYGNIRISEVIW